MISQRNVRLALVVSSMSLFLMNAQPAHAQYKLQTPDGHQTVAPSDMPQQPTLPEEFQKNASRGSRSIAPSVGVDMPGMPSVTPLNESRLSTHTASSQNGVTAPGQPPQPGSLVLPDGVSSSTRIGPVNPTPFWERAALATFLMIQFAAVLIIAVVLQRTKVVKDAEFQGGHIIDEDHVEGFRAQKPRGSAQF